MSSQPHSVIMSDGRIFTEYRPSSFVLSELKRTYNLKSETETRLFMQKNAQQLMAAGRLTAGSCNVFRTVCIHDSLRKNN